MAAAVPIAMSATVTGQPSRRSRLARRTNWRRCPLASATDSELDTNRKDAKTSRIAQRSP